MYFLCFALLLLGSLAEANQPNLLVLTIDTLRADYLACYGNHRINTPNFDTLASNSLFFQTAICPAPLTLPSHTSFFTGRYPYRHGVRDNAGSVPDEEITLAEILKKAGYHTYAFVGGFPLEKRFGLNQGFDVYDDTFPRVRNRSLDFGVERSADAVAKAALAVNWKEPFFTWIHFYDPHAPYLHGGYAGEIEFVDQQIGEILTKVNPENTWIAVAGDHGESLGEHGERTHRIFLYESTMRVPFWISGPGVTKTVVTESVRLVDFLPTILSFLKLPVPAGIDGVVLPAGAGKEALLESMFPKLQLGWSPLMGIRTTQWKYIEAPRQELYHLKSDPRELRNVASEYPGIVQQMKKKLWPLLGAVQRPHISPETAEQLSALGYIGGSLKDSRIDPKDRIQVWNLIEKAVDEPGNSLSILEKARVMDSANPLVLNFLAQKYTETGRLKEAKKLLSELIRRDPSNSLALFRMTNVCLKSGEAVEALKWAEQLQKIRPRDPDSYILIARAALQLNNPAKAAANLEKVIIMDPRDLESRVDLAHIYLQMQRAGEAERHFLAVLKINPNHLQALNGLATKLFLEKDFDGAEKHLSKALSIHPLDPQSLMNLALLYAETGRTQKAVELYKTVTALPDAPEDWKKEAEDRARKLVEP